MTLINNKDIIDNLFEDLPRLIIVISGFIVTAIFTVLFIVSIMYVGTDIIQNVIKNMFDAVFSFVVIATILIMFVFMTKVIKEKI